MNPEPFSTESNVLTTVLHHLDPTASVYCTTWIPPLGAHAVVGGDVDGVGAGVVLHGQTQVSDGRRAALLHQDVLGLDVPVGDGRLPCRTTT